MKVDFELLPYIRFFLSLTIVPVSIFMLWKFWRHFSELMADPHYILKGILLVGLSIVVVCIQHLLSSLSVFFDSSSYEDILLATGLSARIFVLGALFKLWRDFPSNLKEQSGGASRTLRSGTS